MDIRNFALRKTWLDSYLESPVSMDPLTSNIVNRPNHCPNLNSNTFTVLFKTLKATESEKASLSDMQNLKTFCELIDC